jgi:hypothetical protein
MTANIFHTSLKMLLGLILLMTTHIVIAGDDDHSDDRGAICPCFTTEMINTLFVSAEGFQHDEGDSRPNAAGDPEREPVLANDSFECEPPGGPHNLEVEILFSPPDAEETTLAVGVGFLGLGDEPGGAGTCSIITQKEGEEFFLFSVGAEPNQLIIGADGISKREMRACKRAILRSLIWRTFCPTEPEPD